MRKPVDRFTGPLMGASMVLFGLSVVVAWLADDIATLNLSCVLITAALTIAFAGGFTRSRYEKARRAALAAAETGGTG